MQDTSTPTPTPTPTSRIPFPNTLYHRQLRLQISNPTANPSYTDLTEPPIPMPAPIPIPIPIAVPAPIPPLVLDEKRRRHREAVNSPPRSYPPQPPPPPPRYSASVSVGEIYAHPGYSYPYPYAHPSYPYPYPSSYPHPHPHPAQAQLQDQEAEPEPEQLPNRRRITHPQRERAWPNPILPHDQAYPYCASPQEQEGGGGGGGQHQDEHQDEQYGRRGGGQEGRRERQEEVSISHPRPVHYANIRPLTVSRPRPRRTWDGGGRVALREVGVGVDRVGEGGAERHWERYAGDAGRGPEAGRGRQPARVPTKAEQRLRSSGVPRSRSTMDDDCLPSNLLLNSHPREGEAPTRQRQRQRRYPTMLSYVNEGEERTSYVPPAQRREHLDGGEGVSRAQQSQALGQARGEARGPTRPPTQAQLYAQAYAQAGAGGRTGSTADPPQLQAHASRARAQAQDQSHPRSHQHQHPRPTGAGAGAGVVEQQPRRHPGMPMPNKTLPTGIKTGNRNALGIPFSTDGKRDWSTDLCLYCEHDVGTWCSALWCPCIVYGKNKARLERLSSPLPSPSPPPRGENSKAHPDAGPSACSDDCAVHACLTVFCLFGWAIQVPSRAHIRRRYSIHGSWIEDCAAALFCTPCALAQESKEIELEERSLGLGLGVGTERERERERERWARVQYSGIYARR